MAAALQIYAQQQQWRSQVVGYIAGLPVSVKAYGAKGDGVTNDTAAFQTALATGQDIYVPDGTYILGNLTMTTAGQTLYGSGDNSILRASTVNIAILSPQADYITIRDLRMEGICTVSPSANTGIAIITAAQANPAKHCTVSRVHITGADASHGASNGIKFDNDCDFGTVTGCTIERLWGSASGTGYGVLSACSGAQILDNTIIMSSGRGRHGIYQSTSVLNWEVRGNYVSGSDYDAITTNANTTAESRGIIAHNILVGCVTTGNSTSGAIGIADLFSDILIQGNIIYQSGAQGIIANGTGETASTRVVAEGNVVLACQLTGINIIAVSNVAIRNNLVWECSQASAGTYTNIRIVSDGTTPTDFVLVSGNHSTGTSFARSPFQINSTPPLPTSVKLDGNYFPDCQLTGIELGGAVAIIDGRIRYAQTYDPPNIANGASFTLGGISVPGASQGDIVTVGFTTDHTGFFLMGQCYSTGLCQVIFGNLSGGAVDLASGTLRLDVWKRTP